MSPWQLEDILQRRFDAVEERIRDACARAGRRREEVRLVAVTKNAPDEALYPFAGIWPFWGENRPQELWRKIALLKGTVKVDWHLIGHLQRNKVDRTIPLVRLIHSVDSVRLLQAVDEAAARLRPADPLGVLLEVNTSGEASKQGFDPEAVAALAEPIHALRSVRVGGLMTMAPFAENPETCRPCFARLRELRDELASALGGADRLPALSMGMSNDFEVAIEEGATLVRIGSALFEGLKESAG